MAQALPLQGVLRVVPPAKLEEALQREAEAQFAAQQPVQPELSGLAGFIRSEFEVFKRHRDDAMAGWSHRMLDAMRMFNGKYDEAKLAEIKKFAGSEVYARVVATKCRGATSLLRDVYLAPDRPWGISPPSDPDVPPEVQGMIRQLIQVEVQELAAMGQMPDAVQVRDRANMLMEAARQNEKGQADKRARLAEERIEEILDQGGFYKALAEFLIDLPLQPLACLKGPVVRIVPTVDWSSGQPMVSQQPRMFWQRVSPFDIYFTPGVSDIEDGAVIERIRLTRGDLNDLLDLPGYNHGAVTALLDEYGRGGIYDDLDAIDTQRAQYESRENPHYNRSGLFFGLEYHGNVQGRMLLEQGFDTSTIADPVRDYMVQSWVIGRYVIKVQLSPSPRKRHPYFVTSFEKVPGTPVGNAIPDILADIQDVCNATLRALVNNLSISSGPQVDVNVDRLAPDADPNSLFPWKRWFTTSDPNGNNSQPAVNFFQPQSNAQELLAVYQQFVNIADELSAIPKYQTGSGATGGAGRTASGLAMLMGNASKLLQTVASNIDRDVMSPALSGLHDMLMLTDTSGVLRGDEAIRVMGVNVAQQRETQRARQLEFLQITANPIDSQITGLRGRANVLRSVAHEIGIDGEKVVPPDDKLAAMEQATMMPGQPPGQPPGLAQAGAQAQGGQQGPAATQDMGPRTRIAGGAG